MAVLRISFFLVLLSVGTSWSQEPAISPMEAEKLLRDAKLPTDGPGLKAFFQQRTLSDEQRNSLVKTVSELGADDFEMRELASQEVARAGIAALPLLRAAVRSTDPEIVRRAERALDLIANDFDTQRLLAAAQVLLANPPAGTVETMLAYLPSVQDDEGLFEGIVQLLTDYSRKGPPAPVLLESLASKDTIKRLIAGRILVTAQPGQTERVRALLTDADPTVRLQIGLAFLKNGDRSVMPELLKLFTDGPTENAFRMEDVLCQLLNGEPPAQTLGNAEPDSRRRCREAWENWWRQKGEQVDLKLLASNESIKGLTLIIEVDNYNGGFNGASGRIWECGPDGKQRWEMANVGGPVDVQVLPGGRFLVAEYYARRVTERDRTGKILWDSGQLNNNPVSCQRLSNGNTLIATMNELIELKPDLKRVGNFPRPPGTIYHARRGKNGNTFYLSNGQLYEIDPAGKTVKTINVGNTTGWAGFELLPNGHILMSYYVASNRVAELDGNGKVVWDANSPTPTRAQRLRNGNTLVAGGNQSFVYEYDRNKKEVWKVATRGRPFSVLRY